jgi:hypothetical protein
MSHLVAYCVHGPFSYGVLQDWGFPSSTSLSLIHNRPHSSASNDGIVYSIRGSKVEAGPRILSLNLLALFSSNTPRKNCLTCLQCLPSPHHSMVSTPMTTTTRTRTSWLRLMLAPTRVLESCSTLLLLVGCQHLPSRIPTAFPPLGLMKLYPPS